MAVLWFGILALTAVGGFMLGRRLGCGPAHRAWLGMLVALGVMTLWTWLLRHPAVAVNALPVEMLSYVEGGGAVPLFMVIVGVAFGKAQTPGQRRLTVLAAFFGGVFFLQGSMWMLQSTPSRVMGDGQPIGGMVMQSQDFTCVPAACATALNQLGVPATEAEMAELTHTRPGTGATLIRAMQGLNHRLRHTRFRVELIEPGYDELTVAAPPLLTPLRFEPQRLHMVVILGVHEHWVHIADPQIGWMRMTRKEFEDAYTGRVLRFVEE